MDADTETVEAEDVRMDTDTAEAEHVEENIQGIRSCTLA